MKARDFFRRSAEEDGVGLVLSGGGAKGAYQAGVWKAMAELGLAARVRAISGTSIGAINAAAFATLRDPAAVEKFWMEGVGKAADVRLPTPDVLENAATGLAKGKMFPLPGVLDRSGLERMLRRMMPKTWPEGGPAVWATALECRGDVFGVAERESYALRRFRVDAEPDPERRLKVLLASAAIPWGFDPVEIDGATYVDGGWEEMGGDNTPLDPVLRHPGLRTVVVVRLNSEEAEPDARRLPRTLRRRIVEIRPSETLPGPLDLLGALVELGGGARTQLARALRVWSGTFAFHSAYAARSFALGHADALARLG